MIDRNTNIQAALRSRQRGFLLNPFRFGGGGGGPADPNFSSVKLLLPMDGTNGSTSFTDLSPVGRAVTANGNAQITTTDPKWGTGAGLFDGSGDYLSIASSTDFDLGTTYTIEFWIKPNSLSNFGVLHRGLYNTSINTWTEFAFSIRYLGSSCRFYFYATNSTNEQYIDVNSAFSTSEYRHCAMVRNGTGGQIFINGTSAGTISGLNTPAASSRPLIVGLWDYSSGAEYFNGRLDDIRITKGVARYTANFTPPTAPFPNS